MSFQIWLSFVAVVCVAVLSPGPAVLLAITHGTQHGPGRAVFPILGNVSGLAILITASSFGIGSVLSASSDWFFWMRLVGGLYLVFLGAKLLWSSRSNALAKLTDESHLKVHSVRWKTYFQGIGVALSNPKALLVIGALFPQFIDVTQPINGQLMVLGATLIVMSFSVLMMYAALSKSIVKKSGINILRKINKTTGALFVILGLSLAVGSR